jgi:hypothetical protein
MSEKKKPPHYHTQPDLKCCWLCKYGTGYQGETLLCIKEEFYDEWEGSPIVAKNGVCDKYKKYVEVNGVCNDFYAK